MASTVKVSQYRLLRTFSILMCSVQQSNYIPSEKLTLFLRVLWHPSNYPDQKRAAEN